MSAAGEHEWHQYDDEIFISRNSVFVKDIRGKNPEDSIFAEVKIWQIYKSPPPGLTTRSSIINRSGLL